MQKVLNMQQSHYKLIALKNNKKCRKNRLASTSLTNFGRFVSWWSWYPVKEPLRCAMVTHQVGTTLRCIQLRVT